MACVEENGILLKDDIEVINYSSIMALTIIILFTDCRN